MVSESERVDERVRSTGVAGANAFDLLSLALSRNASDADANQAVARELLARLGALNRILTLDAETIKEHAGLEPFEVLRFQALIELGRRAAGAGKGTVQGLDTAADAAQRFMWLRNEKKEYFCVALLDAKNVIIGTRTIHIGTLGMSIVGAREVFREPIRDGASSIILIHNHPSGDSTPSPEDLDVTERLVQIGKMLEIPVLDHVIIGNPGFTSLKRQGAM